MGYFKLGFKDTGLNFLLQNSFTKPYSINKWKAGIVE